MFMRLFNVLGGLAIFIYGMRLMSNGLHLVAGDKMRSILHLFSINRFVSIISGAAVTSVLQSSSASTVMVIGFVNAGLLTLAQSIGIIFGANIGTTITAQLVAFNVNWIVMPSICLGLVMTMNKKEKLTHWGGAVLGLGFLFLGLHLMGSELKELASHPASMKAFQLFKCAPVDGMIPFFPTLGAVLVGMIFTFIVQSSSACTGIIIILGANGMIDLYTATALVLGSNIGTTITAQLAAIPANRIAKQAALAHTLFNFIGAGFVIASYLIHVNGDPIFFAIIKNMSHGDNLPRQIANAHTLFNVATTLLLLPFIPMLARLCERVIPAQQGDIRFKRLEPNLLGSPSIALAQTSAALQKMLHNATLMIISTFKLYDQNDEENQKIISQLTEREADIDERQQDIASYLTRLMQKGLSPAQSAQIPLLLHCTNDVERIGDHASVINDIMRNIYEHKIQFSETAVKEYHKLIEALEEHCLRVKSLLADNRPEKIEEAKRFRAYLYNEIDKTEKMHMRRVSDGGCKAEVAVSFLELIEEVRKILRHLSNITDRVNRFYVRPGALSDEFLTKEIGQ